MSQNHRFQRMLLAGLSALLLATALPARACDCAICKSLPKSEADRVEDFHRHLDEFTKESTRLQLALVREDEARVNEQLLAMVKKWLALHNTYYTRGPGKATASESWQERMVAINRLVADAFRDGRQGDLEEVKTKTGQLSALLQDLDESIGAPRWHVAMLELRHALALGLDPGAAAAKKQPWLEARLRQSTAFWLKLPESERPDDDDGKPLDIAANITALLAAPKAQRPAATKDTLAFLDERLATFRERIGGAKLQQFQP